MAFSLDAGFPRPFGPYVLLSSYGRGGMGEVFLAIRRHIEGIDQLCVLKTLRRDVSRDKSYVRRFLDEARVVVRLNHRNICSVFEVGQVADEYFMAMEHVEGVNLRELLSSLAQHGEMLARPLALHIMAEVCEALSYAHDLVDTNGEPLKLVHRDVSPHNVMIGFDGRVKLIDFGLAESTLKQEHTESHIVLGKVAYMSPEQARGETVDASADQYSLAIMLYEALAGDRFFGDMNTPQIWAIADKGGHVPRRFAALDREARATLSRALSSKAADRFSSCRDFKDAILGLSGVQDSRKNREELGQLMARLFPADIARAQAFSQELSQKTLKLPSDANELTVSLHAKRDDLATIMLPRSASHAAPPRRKQSALVAATMGLVAIAAGVFVASSRQEPATVVEVAPPAPPPVVAIAPPAPPPVAPPPAPPAPDAASEPVEKRVQTKRKKTKTPNDVVETPPVEPAQRTLTAAEAISALRSCDKPCAQLGLRALEQDPAAMSKDHIGKMVNDCVKRQCL